MNCITLSSQNVNSDIYIMITKYSQGWGSFGYNESINFSITNNSNSTLLLAGLWIYNYYNTSFVYYNPEFSATYLYPSSSINYTYNNTSGSSFIMEEALVIEFFYFNLTQGSGQLSKKVLKRANSISTNIALDDISDNTNGIEHIYPDINTNKGKNIFYDYSGRNAREPHKGINIVRTKNGKTKKIVIK